MNIWTVYYRKDNDTELAMHFESEIDAMTFRNVALDHGYIAYYITESIHTKYDSWMTKYLAK